MILEVSFQNCLAELTQIHEGLLAWNSPSNFSVGITPPIKNIYPREAKVVRDYFNFIELHPSGSIAKALPVEHYKIKINSKSDSGQKIYLE